MPDLLAILELDLQAENFRQIHIKISTVKTVGTPNWANFTIPKMR